MKRKIEYNKTEDHYPEMTIEAVKKLWNTEKYTINGLRNIALLLLHWVENAGE